MNTSATFPVRFDFVYLIRDDYDEIPNPFVLCQNLYLRNQRGYDCDVHAVNILPR